MALAEAAKLIATLDLGGNFVKNLGGADRALSKFDSHIDRSQSKAFQAGQHIGLGIKNAAVIAAAGVGVLATNIGLGLHSLVELEQQQAQTNAVIKSTKGAAGISAQAVGDLAEKYENLNAIIGDEVIRSTENMLLTFTNVKGKAFEPALKAILDMNTALGNGPEGLQSVAIQVGKALNDPTKGLTALQRVGVTFDKGQVKRIKQLQKEGKTYEAQRIILAELNKEFGGSFIAQGNTTAGKVAKFTDAIEDLQRALATALLPAVKNVADALATFLSDPQTVRDIQKFGEGIAKFLSPENIRAGIKLIKSGFTAIKEIATPILAVVEKVVAAFRALPPDVQKFLIGAVALNKLTGGGVIHIVSDLGGGVAGLIERGVAGGVGGGVGKALATAGLGKLFVQPVFVTNPGFGTGFPGGGMPGPGTGIPGWNPNAGGGGGISGLLKGIPIIGVAIAGAELANVFASTVAEKLGALFPKGSESGAGQGDVIGNVIKTTVGSLTGALGIPNLVSGIQGLIGNIQAILPLIDAVPSQIHQLIAAGGGADRHTGTDSAFTDTEIHGALLNATTEALRSSDIVKTDDIERLRSTVYTGLTGLDALFEPGVKLDASQITDLRDSSVTAIDTMNGDLSQGLQTVGTNTTSVENAVKAADQQISTSGSLVAGAASLAGYKAAAASTAAGNAVVNALGNLAPPIVQVFFNVTGASVQKTNTVTDKNGPYGGSSIQDNPNSKT